jgi:tRNA-dihydrouridine synthase B
MRFDGISAKLKGKLFLSSMMGKCDAEFCASRAKGCAMVQLGAFVLLKEREERNTYWPDPERTRLTAFMKEQFDTCRAESAKLVGKDNVPVISANVFPCADEDVETSAAAFIEAGGDIYELNAHGGIGGDRERGTGRMLFIPEHTPKLMRWAKILVEAGGPVIIKGRGGAIPDYTEYVKQLEQIGVHAFHINVRDEETSRQDLELLENIRKATGMFLLASGYVKDADSARALFSAGADCVGIAQAASSDPDIFVKCGA